MKRSGFLGVALLTASASHAQELKCEIENKYVCEASGCKPAAAKVWNIINVPKRTYARCDSMGCDTYEAHISVSGVFMNIEVLGRGLIAKMAPLDQSQTIKAFSFHEVATQLHAVYVSFGSCKWNG